MLCLDRTECANGATASVGGARELSDWLGTGMKRGSRQIDGREQRNSTGSLRKRWALVLLIGAATIAVATAADVRAQLIISQYYEGTSNNKWIEIYNLGSTAVELSPGGYRLGGWFNADAENWKTTGAGSQTLNLTGIIAPNGSYLLSNSSAVEPFAKDLANQTGAGPLSFNGDDSVVLYTGSTYSYTNVVDAIGLADASTEIDRSYSRKISVVSGTNLDFNAADWDQFTLAEVNDASANNTFGNERMGGYRGGGYTITWDANGYSVAGAGGSGNWTTTNSRFTAKPGGSAVAAEYFNWSDARNRRDNLLFGGTAGNVLLTGPRVVGGLMFKTTGYEISGADQTLTFDGTGYIDTIGSAVTATISTAIAVSPGVNITKTGAGTLVLSGPNSYTSLTHVSMGTLKVLNTGTISGSVRVGSNAAFDVSDFSSGYTVAPGRTLSGSGTVAGKTIVAGTLSPGSSFGKLTFTDDISLANTATYLVALGGVGGTPGTAGVDYSQAVVSGAGSVFTVGGAALKILPMSGIVTGQPYTVVSTANSGSIDYSTVFAGLVQVSANQYSGQDGALSYIVDFSDSSISVTFSSVPEPATALLGLFGGIALLHRRPRRRASR